LIAKARAEARPLPITTLKRIMKDRRLDSTEKAVIAAMLVGLADEDGVVIMAEEDLANALELTRRSLRLALGALWAGGYFSRFEWTDGVSIQITLGGGDR